MAQKVQTLFIDDLDGSEAAGTVRFGLDGTHYEIDLNPAHTNELHGILEHYIAHARRAGNTARRASRSSGRRANNGLNIAKIREWARGQGIDIKERGRVPANVIEKYQATVGA
jgi:hypothetical protein